MQSLLEPRPWRSIFLYVQVYAAIVIVMFVAVKVANPIVTVLSIIIIAGRQHSLYILNHDASHYSLFKSKLANKYIATLFSNCAMFHHPEAWSFVQWRRVHLKHHAFLFTEYDPNYLGRQRAGHTEKRLTHWELFKACLMASPSSAYQFFMGKQDYVQPKSYLLNSASLNHFKTLFKYFSKDPEMLVENLIKWIFLIAAIIGINYFQLWQPFLLLWLIPMYTVYPMILKFHDLTEHYWEQKSTDHTINANSVSRGFFAKCLFSFLPRGLHREHHGQPRVCVVDLPKLKFIRTTDCKEDCAQAFNLKKAVTIYCFF